MAQQGGFGVKLKITPPAGVATIVAHLLDIGFPEFSKFIAESTGHDSPGGYYEAIASGKRRVQPFTATIGWDIALATHQAMVDAFDSNLPLTFSVEDPLGLEVISFSGHVEKVNRMTKQEDTYKAEVTIHPTGTPSITP